MEISAATMEKYLPAVDLYLFNTGQAQRAYLVFGCHYLPELTLHRFVVWAPRARYVSVVGDFNNWNAAAHPMTKRADGIFYAFIPGLRDGDIYKYAVTGADGVQTMRADPFAFHAETGPHTASRVWDIDYEPGWQDAAYLAARQKQNIQRSPVSIYELHLGSWKKAPSEVYPNYRRIAPELAAYCTEMGYTHVELLPLCEFPFDGSWGYQTTGYFAPTSRYGTPQDLMSFVDTLHAAGIGVILDWSPAHFPRDAHALARFDGAPLFEPADARRASHPQWGTLIFDYERPQVVSFLVSSAMLFFDLYHIDGLRVDAVSSMLYVNYGRGKHELLPGTKEDEINKAAVVFLRRLNSTILSFYPGCLTAAEESTAFPLVTRPPDVGGLGFTFKWDMGFMHDTLEYFSLDPLYRSHHHDKLTFSMMYAFAENFILAFSHDEVVHGKASLLNKMFGSYDEKFAALRALYGYIFAHPGKKLLFMGGEFGQFIEWNDGAQLDWHLLDYPRHAEMQRWVSALNHLYQDHDALWLIEDSWDGFQWLAADECERSALAFMRTGGERTRLIFVGNFTPIATTLSLNLPAPGTLNLILNSDEYCYGGNNCALQHQIMLNDLSQVKLTLPPLSVQFYVFDQKEEADENGD